ncbi:MAG: hypothetical protein ACYTFH_05300 [Planctomycetota bacterium]|jgi:hypothetical protein
MHAAAFTRPWNTRRPRLVAASAVVVAGLLGVACEDPGSAPRPAVVDDPGPATSAGAAKRSAERIEERIGDYQQQLMDQMDAGRNDSAGAAPDLGDR